MKRRASAGNDIAAAPSPDAASPLAHRFAAHLRGSGLIEPGARVLVAVSGGIDSMTLLHLLRFHPPLPLDLHAAHFDHRMRERSADDLAWVAAACRAWNVPFQSAAAEAVPRGEAEARDARYAFLFAAARRAGASAILTAHHAGDQAETVVFRLLRGTGVSGLAGIPRRRGTVVRPLLPFTRAEIAAHASAAGVEHREDPSNLLLDRTRNRIRHVVLPALESVHAGVVRLLATIADDAASVNARWERGFRRVAETLVQPGEAGSLELARGEVLRYHPVVRARVLRAAIQRFGCTPGRAGTRAALEFIRSGAGGGGIELAGGVRLERDFDRFVLRRGTARGPAADQTLVIDEPGEGRSEAVIGGTRFHVQWSRSTRDAGGHASVFDPTVLRFPLELRGWRPGDRIQLGYGGKKLKKLFAERRIARGTRSRIPVLAESGGGDRILWVVGHARAAAAVPAEGGPTLHITVRNAEHG